MPDLQQLLTRPIKCVHLGKRTRECHVYTQLGHTYDCKLLRKSCGRTRLAKNIKVCCEECPSYQAKGQIHIEPVQMSPIVNV